MELSVVNFFKTVLPQSGAYYAVARRAVTDNYPRHAVCVDIEAMLSKLDLVTPQDYWFAPAKFTQGYHDVVGRDGNTRKQFRTANNVAVLRSYWLDIDVGEDKPYQTTEQAMRALRQFMVDTGMPIPTIVFSGSGGMHLYWSADQDISKTHWLDMASRLKEMCERHNFHADPARTTDCASLLRFPNTFNQKGGTAKPVQLIHIADQYPLETLDSIMAKYEPTVSHEVAEMKLLQDIASMDWSIYNIDTAPITEVQVAEVEFPKRPASEVVAQCKQIALQNGAIEPVWRGMLATLRHCEGGIEMAHTLSKQDPRYNAGDTNGKIIDLEVKQIPPYTCAKFQQLRPEVCLTCPHKGKINSPISVPTSEITVVEVDDETGEVEKLLAVEVENSEELGVPDIHTGKYKVDETGCWVLLEDKRHDRSWWHCFYPYPVFPIQKLRDKSPTGDIEVSYIFRKFSKRGYDDFQLKGDTLMGQGITAFLGSVGFLLDQEERKHMAGFMIDLLKELDGEIEETSSLNRLGWDDDMKTFLLGNKLYKDDGVIVNVTPKGLANEYSNQTVPRGSLEQWKKIANVYNREGLEWGQVAVASAFASPLMPIGSLERAALLFLTGEKGAGKSTALSLAVSVFGNPTRMMVNKDDTFLARLAKLGIMSNISVGFDEMTDLSPKEASDLAYQITQGRGKDRMADGGKGIQHNTTYWSCLPVMSANDSIINALAQHSFDSTAQMSRVLEIEARDINTVYSKEEFQQCEMLVRSLPQNYGTAGDVYMRWVVTHQEQVKEMLYKTERMFIERTGLNNNFRFWTYMCTRMLVGTMIAKKLGLVDYDIENMLEYLCDVVLKAMAKITGLSVDIRGLLGNFLTEHIGNRIVVTSDKRPDDRPFRPQDGPLNDVGYVITPPATGRDLHIRIERDSNICYISIKAIKDWCKLNKIPYDTFMLGVAKSAKVISEKERMVIGRNTQFNDVGRVYCVMLELSDAMMDTVEM